VSQGSKAVLERLGAFIQELQALHFQVPEDDAAVARAALFAPRLVHAIEQAIALLQSTQDFYAHALPAEEQLAHSESLHDIGRLISSEIAGQEITDVLFLARSELRGAQWFHAASTIKLPLLLALFHAVAEGSFGLDDWLHVRNRFASRLDGEPFRVPRERDSDGMVHAETGKLMRIRDLAERMIVASSNLATNLLLDLVGAREAQRTLQETLALAGIDLVRGVEDERAHAAGINNRVTADGLLAALRLLHDPGPLAGELAREATEVLLRQELSGGLKRGLPAELREQARVAHKTGEISTVAHDAGLVFLPERKPYALVVLSEWEPGANSRQATLGRVAQAVYEELVAPPPKASAEAKPEGAR
jgi:beta-lactamase class A